MNKDSKLEGDFFKNKWRFLPYLSLGIVIFSLNSLINLNFFVKGYVVLLETQIGFVLLYFLMRKLGKINKKKDKFKLME